MEHRIYCSALRVLEKAGLVRGRGQCKYVKNLPGRKTDMSDCQWQATLHATDCSSGVVPPSTSVGCKTPAIAHDHTRWRQSRAAHAKGRNDDLKITQRISDADGVMVAQTPA